MNNKGVTLIELLIVIVVIGIIAAFSLVAVTSIIENNREDSFVNTANIMVTAASKALNQNDALWNDDEATLKELLENDYMEVQDDDPWGESYNKENSVVTIDLEITLISGTATIGYDVPLSEFDKSNIVYLNRPSTGIPGIIENITGNVTSIISGDNDNDDITVSNNVSSNAEINTFAGDDTVSVGNDLNGSAEINTGSGNDTVTIGNDIRGTASINTGDGDDTIQIDRWLRDRTSLDAGSGNDTITIAEIRYGTRTFAGDGNDTVTINSVLGNFYGTLDVGAGDDILTISDGGNPFSGVRGTFSGGTGNDILNLLTVNTARWNQISHLFSGFETINLTDSTITN